MLLLYHYCRAGGWVSLSDMLEYHIPTTSGIKPLRGPFPTVAFARSARIRRSPLQIANFRTPKSKSALNEDRCGKGLQKEPGNSSNHGT